MSAFEVSKKTMDVVITAAIEHAISFSGRTITAGPATDRDTEISADDVGDRLFAVNYDNLRYLYAERHEITYPRLYFYTPAPASAFVAHKQACCLRYQCSDQPGWVTSAENRFCERLKTAIEAAVGLPVLDIADHPEWQAAPWDMMDD